MDPLSIATAVVGLTATCLSTCKKLSDLAESYEDIPLVIAMLCSESTVISVALSQLQILILQRDDLSQAWASKTDIFDAFEMSLNGCMVVFSCLEAETRQLQTQMPGSAGKRVWTKIKFMWNQDRLKELLTSLRGQQSSINFLLQVLECKTLSDIQRDVRLNREDLRASAADAQSLRSRNPSVRTGCQSVFDNDTHRLSMFADDLVSVVAAPSELNFEFDDFVLNSQAYRRVFAKAQSQHVQVQTITEDLIDLSDNTLEIAAAATVRYLHEDLAGLDINQRPSSQHERPPQSRPISPFSQSKSFGLEVQNGLLEVQHGLLEVQHGLLAEGHKLGEEGKELVSQSKPATATSKTCARCNEPIRGRRVLALNHRWHLECFTCIDCNVRVAEKFFPNPDNDMEALCARDYFRRLDLLCDQCGDPLRGSYITACGKKFHFDHFGCEHCDAKFKPEDSYFDHEGHILCFYCRLYANRCSGCQWPITKDYVEVKDGPRRGLWHLQCEYLSEVLDLRVLPTVATNRLLLSFEDSQEDAMGGLTHDNDRTRMLTNVMELTVFILELFTKLAASALEKCAEGDADGGWKHWNAITALTDLLFRATTETLRQPIADPLSDFALAFAGFLEGFHRVPKPEIFEQCSDQMAMGAKTVLRHTLLQVFKDADWHAEDSRLGKFLTRLCVVQKEDPPLSFADIEPVKADREKTNCQKCRGYLDGDAYTTTLSSKSLGAPRWHKECWTCLSCGSVPEETGTPKTFPKDQYGDVRQFLCDQCGQTSDLRLFPYHEQFVDLSWVCWAGIRPVNGKGVWDISGRAKKRVQTTDGASVHGLPRQE